MDSAVFSDRNFFGAHRYRGLAGKETFAQPEGMGKVA